MEDKYKAQKKYAKSNIKKLSCSFNKDFVEQFVEACHALGITQAQVVREAMQNTIDQAQKKSAEQ